MRSVPWVYMLNDTCFNVLKLFSADKHMLQKNCYGTFHWSLILSLFHEILQLHFVMTLFKRKKCLFLTLTLCYKVLLLNISLAINFIIIPRNFTVTLIFVMTLLKEKKKYIFNNIRLFGTGSIQYCQLSPAPR